MPFFGLNVSTLLYSPTKISRSILWLHFQAILLSIGRCLQDSQIWLNSPTVQHIPNVSMTAIDEPEWIIIDDEDEKLDLKSQLPCKDTKEGKYTFSIIWKNVRPNESRFGLLQNLCDTAWRNLRNIQNCNWPESQALSNRPSQWLLLPTKPISQAVHQLLLQQNHRVPLASTHSSL